MFGNNPIRPPEKGDGSRLQVQKIFHTLQGEGPYSGEQAVFVRLGGCNLACDFCDTEFEDFRELALAEIIETVEQKRKEGTHLVVLTGGEPLRQPVERLCEELLAKGLKVQIETNGTLYRDLPEGVEIVCSPKVTNGGYHPVRDDVLRRIDALKFLISTRREAYRAIPELGQKELGIPVYLQPMDEFEESVNQKNQERATELAMAHGYHLSLQIHKMLGIE